jgi:hypothetical protein
VDETEFVREVARTLRSRLAELAGEDADDIDRALAEVLNRPGEADVQVTPILTILARHPSVHAEAARAVQRRSASGEPEALRDIGTPPGRGDPDYRPRRYACPRGDFAWYRRTVVQQPPPCPTHQVRLEPADRI